MRCRILWTRADVATIRKKNANIERKRIMRKRWGILAHLSPRFDVGRSILDVPPRCSFYRLEVLNADRALASLAPWRDLTDIAPRSGAIEWSSRRETQLSRPAARKPQPTQWHASQARLPVTRSPLLPTSQQHQVLGSPALHQPALLSFAVPPANDRLEVGARQR